MRNRLEILSDLIPLKQNPIELQNELSNYPWDSEKPLIIMTKNDFENVIQKAINDRVSFAELEDWANVIECRDDIGFDPEDIQEYIFDLASPELNGKITKERLKQILNSL